MNIIKIYQTQRGMSVASEEVPSTFCFKLFGFSDTKEITRGMPVSLFYSRPNNDVPQEFQRNVPLAANTWNRLCPSICLFHRRGFSTMFILKLLVKHTDIELNILTIKFISV